jgi:hypothetical protein
MPRKPLHPTIYPPQTRASSIQAFASIVARSAVRIAQLEENQSPVEPDVKQNTVHNEASVNARKHVVQLMMRFNDED